MNDTAPIRRAIPDEYLARRNRAIASLHAVAGQPLRLSKDTSNLFRDRAVQPRARLDLRDFDHVLAVDTHNGTIDAEGMATFDTLVASSLPYGVMPQVVPELKTITVGGATSGVGIEATSFRYGLVHDTVEELEVLTAAGEIVLCRADNEHADLFHGFPNSYGTLGYALRVRVRALAVRPYVEVTHQRFGDPGEFFAALANACRSTADFVDAVAFAPGELYLNVGRFVDSAPYTSDYTYERIYYRSIRERDHDYLTARDYLWRWDTDWFWCSKHVGAQNPLLRRLYGRSRLSSRTYQKIMRWNAHWGLTSAIDRMRGGHRESVIQDVDIPIGHAAQFLSFFEREIGLAPVWLCPVIGAPDADRFALYRLAPGELYVNFGFWDVLRRPQAYPAGHFNRLIEAEVMRLGGIKSLYSDSYFSREEFARAYGGEAYRALKARYDPSGTFPDVYDKCVLRH
ncbi:MAG TPA: FAD-binding oxidoreductase [Casimicrobiaceae bacterium]|nr:FAD-binding oxidoreductase [Casimicrobiaceae bacterium]